jgi:hypothetical protein
MGQIGGRTTTRQQREGPTTLLVCTDWGSCSRESSERMEVMDRNVIWATVTTRAQDAAAHDWDDAVVRAQDVTAFHHGQRAAAAARVLVVRDKVAHAEDGRRH